MTERSRSSSDLEKKVFLRPIKESTEDYEAIERHLRELFKKHIYYPILKILAEPKTILNSNDSPLIKAIYSGKVGFSNGSFVGAFSADISKELKAMGAKWDRATDSWKIRKSILSMEVRSAISLSEVRFIERLKSIDEALKKIVPEDLAHQFKAEKFFDRTIFRVNRDFERSIRNITIAPKLSMQTRKKLADEWSNDMKLHINNFTKSEIQSLRAKVQKSGLAGKRYESLISTIQKSYSVSENKAKFLARQETSLMITKLKESRYKDAGADRYIWKCVAGTKNHPVRPSHKRLEGTEWSWDNPPITSEPKQPTRRNNPGQDFNCRCFARPIVKFKKKKGK